MSSGSRAAGIALAAVTVAGLAAVLLVRASTLAGPVSPVAGSAGPARGEPGRVLGEESEHATSARLPLGRAGERLAAVEAGSETPVDGAPGHGAAGEEHSEGALEEALAWLARLDRERFGTLTAEEAAALEQLDLRGTEPADDDLRHLAALPALTSLSLRGTTIGDAGLVHLQGLALETLELRGTPVTGVGLGSLPWTLESLDLTDTLVESADLYRLPGLPGLRTLDLNFIALDDTALEPLARMPALRHLECDQSGVTGEGLAMLLQRNPLLARIEVRDTAVTDDQARALMQRHPGCELVWQSSVGGRYGQNPALSGGVNR